PDPRTVRSLRTEEPRCHWKFDLRLSSVPLHSHTSSRLTRKFCLSRNSHHTSTTKRIRKPGIPTTRPTTRNSGGTRCCVLITSSANVYRRAGRTCCKVTQFLHLVCNPIQDNLLE